MRSPPSVPRLFRGLAVFSIGGLLLVVLGAATVAVFAEFVKTWRWYFRMEQAMALATPATLVLLVLSVVGLAGTVALADRD
jgi:hypothetical protein